MIRNIVTREQEVCHQRCFFFAYEAADDLSMEETAEAEIDAAIEGIEYCMQWLIRRIHAGRPWMGISVSAVADADDVYEFTLHINLPSERESYNEYAVLYTALLPSEKSYLTTDEILHIVGNDRDFIFALNPSITIEAQMVETLQSIAENADGYEVDRDGQSWRLRADESLRLDLVLRSSMEAVVHSTQAQAIVRFLISRPGEAFRVAQLAASMRDDGRVYVRGDPTAAWQTGDQNSPETFYIQKYSTSKSFNDATKQVRSTMGRAMNTIFPGGAGVLGLDHGVLEQWREGTVRGWLWQYTAD